MPSFLALPPSFFFFLALMNPPSVSLRLFPGGRLTAPCTRLHALPLHAYPGVDAR